MQTNLNEEYMNIIKKYILVLGLLIIFPISSVEANNNQYGSPYDDSIPLKPINLIFESSDMDGKVFSFQGVITSQCKADGCWFKLKDSTREIMVDLKPYDFRPSLDIVGKRVKLNGKVNSKEGNVKIDAFSVVVLE